MDLKQFWPLLVVLTVALAQRNSEGERTSLRRGGPRTIGGSVVPQGAASLAFVFDITGSMYDDLVQVIEGAAKILRTTLARRDKPLYNYVLVPFHDPEIGPITVTTDPGEFQQELRDLYVQGGGDCPEMSIGAIRNALQVSLPNSFIYVFTDARAKDYILTEQVLGLIQEKQSQVVFVMTGDCGNTSHPGFKAYEQVASTSSGQVFLLKKSQVNEVLKFVSEAVQSQKVNLMSTDHHIGGKTIVEIPIDANLMEITISLSGEKPRITLYGPNGKEITRRHGLETLLNIKRALIVNLKDPNAGVYKLVVESDSAHTLRITGLSDMDFIHGYSRYPTDDISETILRPVKGIATHVVINATGLDLPGNVENFELVDLSGNTLIESRVEPVEKKHGLYNVSQFMPPDDYFYVKVIGMDQEGNQFWRMSPTAITPVLPRAPNVTMDEVTHGHYDQSVNIVCHVFSLVPYYIQWYKDGLKDGPERFFSEPGDVIMTVEKASIFAEGVYTCNATNTAGSSIAQTMLDVKDPPPTIVVQSNATASPGYDAIMTCIAYSSGEVNLTWYRKVNDLKINLQRNPRVQIFNNGSIAVRSIANTDEGKYVCRAMNEGGATEADVYLFVNKPPVVTVTPRRRSYVLGESVNFTCSFTGHPRPVLAWYRSGRRLLPSDSVQYFQNNEVLQLLDLKQRDTGEYECRGRNPAGENRQAATLEYIESPTVRAESPLVMIAVGDSKALRCDVTGIPDPFIRWYKDGKQITEGSSQTVVRIFGREIFLIAVQEHDAGEYKCVAENEAGSASAVIDVDTGSMPTGGVPFYSVAIKVGQSGTLKCDVTGDPKPTYSWTHRRGKPVTDARFRVLPDGSLLVTDVRREDEGLFVCRAENELGYKEVTAQLAVTGIILPKISSVTSSIDIPLGQEVNVTCTVVEGSPPPTLTWIKGIEMIRPDARVSINDYGTLRIRSVTRDDDGDYTCLASNAGGNATHSLRLNVQVPPTIVEGVNEDITVIQGDPITFKCLARGDPRPILTWNKGNDRISVTDPHYIIGEDGSLSIFSVDPQDSGLYTCTAMNVAGLASREVTLTVHIRPTIADDPEDHRVITSKPIILPCRVSGRPDPMVRWYKDGRRIQRNNPRYTFLVDGSMEIISSNVTDIGVYECRASNIAGNTTKILTVQVQSPPSIIDSSGEDGDRVIEGGKSVILECFVKGDPPPKIRWQRNRVDIDPHDPANVNFIPQDNGALYIHRATPAATATYTCIAENPAGISTKDINLIIHEKPKFTGQVPGNTSVIENKGARLPCPAEGTPKPIITWYKNGVVVNSTEELTILKDGTLAFDAARAQDAGTYTCIARNTAGETSHVVEFKVYVPPKLGEGGNGSDPRLPQLAYSLVDNPVVLECKVDAIPPPKIFWYKHGRLVTNTTEGVKVSYNGSALTIHRVTIEDVGRYTCIARNVAGETEKNFDVDVFIPPAIDDRGSSPDDNKFIKGRPAVLECRVSGRPVPKITWYKNGDLLDLTNSNYRVYSQGRRLEIVQVQSENKGAYSCIAKSAAGEVVRNFTMDVHDPPVIKGSDRISRPTVIAGDNVTLTCPASGTPPPRITWYLGDTPIVRNTTRIRLHDKNATLLLLQVEVEDSSRYTCKARNPAGETEKWMDLSVIVPPEINLDAKDLNPRVVVGRSIILSCPASGTPPPEIVWFRNRQILNVRTYSNMEMLSGGRQLRIQAAKIDDSALYTCKAINKAGDREVDFELQVLVPPVIDTSLITSLEREVIVNRTIALQCPATGIPQPNVTWYHQGVAVRNDSRTQFSYDGKVLRITKARTSDAGRYTCQAINAAGQADQRFRLNVLVPPFIDDSQIDRQPKVIVNQSITLSCAPSGIPPPEISWLRNGAPLEQAGRGHISVRLKGRQLHIRGAETRDNARYTCIATNKAGTADIDFDLDVLVPPYISSENIDLKPRINKGSTVLLNCPATGHPFPEITWWRDRQKLVSSDRVRIQSQGRQIEILGSTVADTGLFKCLATNPAGQASLWFDLSVSVAPVIDDSNLVDNPRVIVNRTVILECPVTGVPPPKVRWMKDGQDLLPSTGVQIMSNGRLVKIVRATIRDTARYTCIANNKAGELRRSFSLEVMLPPVFPDYQFESIIEVIENRSVFIECPATGLPQPSFSWQKDGEPIFMIKNMNLRLLNSGRQLHIPYAQLNATGQYTCKARNVAGEAQRRFSLRVLVPPRMNSSSLLEYAVEVTIGETAKINCPVTGTPKPKITWFRDGQPLNFLRFPHMQAPGTGDVLHIAGASTLDRGRYACRATNPAGQVDKYFTLEILVPPSINGSDTMEEINVVKGRTILIRCPVSGSPLPTIRWSHEDRPLFSSDDNIRFLNNGRQLQISNVDGLYVGRYTCTASNPAGTASKDFMVNVSIKPTISYGPSKVTAVNETRVSLLCDAFGQPPPTMTWLKNGQPFIIDGDSTRYRTRPSGTLEIDPVRLEDSGSYRCWANNTAGSTYRDVTLEVQVPPRILTNDLINVNVIENEPATLSCPSFGKPRPRIQWQKGISVLTAAKGYVILEKGDLLIQKASLRDAGKYVCMAQNAAGTAFGEITLNVLVPPDVQIPRDSYTVFNGRTVTLPCRGRGVPKPEVTWLKDGRKIEPTSYRYQVTRSGTLAIPVASESDAGMFTCVVQNTAGTVSKDVQVVVYVPPHIADSKRIFVTTVGEPIVMPCHGEGIPKPKISWWRRGIRIAPNHDNYKITNGTLLIEKVRQSDHGSWVCGADSKAGHDSEQFVVRVQVPPKFTVIPEDQEVNTNGRIELVCHAEGIPTPNIEWTKNGTRIAGMTQASIPYLAREGIVAASFGINSASSPPAMPSPNVWKFGNYSIISYWHKGGYPDPNQITRDNCQFVKGLDHALCFAFRGDNAGPPKDISEIKRVFRIFRKEFPGAEIKASTYDKFTELLVPLKHTFPVVEKEVGDTWTQGPASDPVKMGAYRTINRLRSKCFESGRCRLDKDSRLNNMSRILEKLPEHTYGLARSFDWYHWSNKEFLPLQYNQDGLKNISDDWLAHREFNDVAVEALKDHPLAKEIRQELRKLEPYLPDLSDHSNAEFNRVITCGNGMKLRVGNNGALNLFTDTKGRQWADQNHPLGLIMYRTYNTTDFDENIKLYSYNWDGQIRKPNMELYAKAESKFWDVKGDAVYLSNTGDPCAKGIYVHIVHKHQQTWFHYGAPISYYLKYQTVGTDLEVEYQFFNKPTTRLPESLFLNFRPKPQPKSQWYLHKLGYLVDPTNIILNGSQYVHMIDEGVAYLNTQLKGLTVQSLDLATVAVETKDHSPSPFPSPLEPMPTAPTGMAFNIYNNIWEVNYVLWYPYQPQDKNYKARFVLKLDSVFEN